DSAASGEHHLTERCDPCEPDGNAASRPPSGSHVLRPGVPTIESSAMSEYRIDDLAQAAGVSVRNVRVYREKGLLPPPRREGRAAWYGDGHVARLKLIARMLERGYTFATIDELLTAAQEGLRVRDLLGSAG